MKILMVHPHDLYSQFEPWSVRIKYLARELSKKNNYVKLIFFPFLDRFFKEDKLIKEKKLIEFPLKRRKMFLPANIRILYKLAEDVDVIHFQKCFSYAALPSLIIAFLRNKAVHYDWDDWEFGIYQSFPSASKITAQYINIFEKTIPCLADTVSVTSQHLRKLCIEYGIEENRIFDSHVGADLEKFHPSVSGRKIRSKYDLIKPTVIYVGQLHSAQYADLFIKAAKIILDKDIDVNFMIVGDGFALLELKKIAYNLGLDRKIIFTGAVEHDLVPQYIAASDIAVACFEDNEVTRCKSPLKVAEYMASGKPIVASSVGEIKNMLDGCGILTEPGSVDELAKGIQLLLKDKNLRIELAQKARKRAEERYNWSVTADNLLKAYELAIKIKNKTNWGKAESKLNLI